MGEKGSKITPLSFGCSRLGNAAYEDTTDIAHQVLQGAWDLGIRSFDTASNYTYGDSEKILGAFARGKGEDIFVSTKGGTLIHNKASLGRIIKPIFHVIRPILRRNLNLKKAKTKRVNFNSDYLIDTLERSHARLGCKIDAYKLHNPDFVTLQNKRTVDLFEKIKRKNLAQLCGISVRNFEDLKNCVFLDEIDIIQFPMNYFLFQKGDEGFLEQLRKKRLIMIARMPFHRGALTKYNMVNTGSMEGEKFGKLKAPKKILCERYSASEIQIALWFLKDLGFFDSILFSSFKLEHLKQNVKAFHSEMPSDFSWKDVITTLEA